MCTSISLDGWYGRNMDIEFELSCQVVAVPRRFALRYRCTGESTKHFAIIGMATVNEGVPLFCDAMNEHGLYAAALSFPECRYKHSDSGVHSGDRSVLAPFELIPFVLSQCKTLDEAKALLNKTELVDIPFSGAVPNTPLHWHIADKSGSLAVECGDSGVAVQDDPAGVLTNSPPLPFHLTNLRQYAALSPRYPENGIAEPLGRGFGAIGLPGDFSPTSRFVRAASLKAWSKTSEPRTQLLRILENTAMPHGAVYTKDGREEHTAYTCCMGENSYYWRSYGEMSYSAASLDEIDTDSGSLHIFEK